MFDVKACQAYVESLIQHDEVERALLVLDNIPAFYRDNVPQELITLRAHILASLCTTHAYMSSGLDCNVEPKTAVDNLRFNTRGMLIEAEVKKYNELKLIPHLVDIGPGEYWVPMALMQLGYRFTYWDIAVDQNTQKTAHPLLALHRESKAKSDQPQIFIALEIIEHLPSTNDLVIECLRHCQQYPERIHLSTPRYTYDPSPKEWRKPCGLPHLRAYTPEEFMLEAKRLFQDYEWQMYNGPILSLRGLRRDVSQSKKEPLIGE